MKDFSHWYTKERAATALNCSTKTLERLVSRGLIHMEIWKRPAGASISVYNPKEVDRESQRRNPPPKAFVLPPDRTGKPAIAGDAAPPPNSGDLSILPVPSWAKDKENKALSLSDMSKTFPPFEHPFFDSLVAGALKAGSSVRPLPIDRKLFLSRKEAAEYCGLPKSTIVAAINAGICKAVRTGRGIRVMRESLDSLELAAFLDTFEPPAPRPGPPRRSKGDLAISSPASVLIVPGVESTD